MEFHRPQMGTMSGVHNNLRLHDIHPFLSLKILQMVHFLVLRLNICHSNNIVIRVVFQKFLESYGPSFHKHKRAVKYSYRFGPDVNKSNTKLNIYSNLKFHRLHNNHLIQDRLRMKDIHTSHKRSYLCNKYNNYKELFRLNKNRKLNCLL
jgi:hypothetical protein